MVKVCFSPGEDFGSISAPTPRRSSTALVSHTPCIFTLQPNFMRSLSLSKKQSHEVNGLIRGHNDIAISRWVYA